MSATGISPKPPVERIGQLGPRRRLVALLTAEGLTDKAIAARLGMSPVTVRAHLHMLALQLHVRSDQNARIIIARWVIAQSPYREAA